MSPAVDLSAREARILWSTWVGLYIANLVLIQLLVPSSSFPKTTLGLSIESWVKNPHPDKETYIW